MASSEHERGSTPFELTRARLRPLTSNNADEPSPKALLPIANKPLISFPLTWLEEAGVTGMAQSLSLSFGSESR